MPTLLTPPPQHKNACTPADCTDDTHTCTTTAASGVDNNAVVVSPGQEVMMDVAAWWVHVLLHNRATSLQDFQVLETVLPCLSNHCIASTSSLALRLRALAVWQEVVGETHDFALLQDKLLLLSTEFGQSEIYSVCMEILKVQEQFMTLLEYCRNDNGETKTKSPLEKIEAYQESLHVIFLGKPIPPLLLDLINIDDTDSTTVQQRIESINNDSTNCYSYSNLQSQIRTVLMDWIDNGLQVPELVKLGYRGSYSSLSVNSTTSTEQAATTARGTQRQRLDLASERAETDHSSTAHRARSTNKSDTVETFKEIQRPEQRKLESLHRAAAISHHRRREKAAAAAKEPIIVKRGRSFRKKKMAIQEEYYSSDSSSFVPREKQQKRIQKKIKTNKKNLYKHHRSEFDFCGSEESEVEEESSPSIQATTGISSRYRESKAVPSRAYYRDRHNRPVSLRASAAGLASHKRFQRRHRHYSNGKNSNGRTRTWVEWPVDSSSEEEEEEEDKQGVLWTPRSTSSNRASPKRRSRHDPFSYAADSAVSPSNSPPISPRRIRISIRK